MENDPDQNQNMQSGHIDLSGMNPEAMHGSSHHQPKSSKGKNPFKKFSAWFKHLSKRKKILVVALSILLAAAIGFAAWWFFLKPVPLTPEQAAEQELELKQSKTVPSETTGLPVKPEINDRHVTGVMIENSPDARPQSGLTEADIVYEAIAEAGITRFLALFHDNQPKYVGPVRSARPYFINLVRPYRAGYAHVGGSPEALALIKNVGVQDLDQFSNPQAYHRISTRYAPHNMYTGLDKLDQLEQEKGYKNEEFESFSRLIEPEATPEKIKADKINLSISGPLYDVKFDYNKSKNIYARNMGGSPHKDEKSGKTIAPNVVIALVMKKGIANDGYHTTYQTSGTGTMYLFQSGNVVKGKWRKKDHKTQLEILDSSGNTLELNPGQTWLTIVSEASAVKYKR